MSFSSFSSDSSACCNRCGQTTLEHSAFEHVSDGFSGSRIINGHKAFKIDSKSIKQLPWRGGAHSLLNKVLKFIQVRQFILYLSSILLLYLSLSLSTYLPRSVSYCVRYSFIAKTGSLNLSRPFWCSLVLSMKSESHRPARAIATPPRRFDVDNVQQMCEGILLEQIFCWFKAFKPNPEWFQEIPHWLQANQTWHQHVPKTSSSIELKIDISMFPRHWTLASNHSYSNNSKWSPTWSWNVQFQLQNNRASTTYRNHSVS